MAVSVLPVIAGVNGKNTVNVLGNWLETKALQTLNPHLIVIVIAFDKCYAREVD